MFRRLWKQTPVIDAKKAADQISSTVVLATGALQPTALSPDEALGELFDEVQSRRLYPDGKIFVDMIPKKRARALAKEYLVAKNSVGFNLEDFIDKHYYAFIAPGNEYVPGEAETARQHITNLWPVLRRKNRTNRGSLIALPYDYIVPGGRFSEQFYWDSYFVMLGLAADEEWGLILGMMRNYTYMLRKFGMIPTANRTYFLSRSQPPFFVQMVKLLARHRGRTRTYAEFLPAMLTEYRFWMKGKKSVGSRPDISVSQRVVRMPNGSYLNRYYDNKATPRPESMREDIETAEAAASAHKEKIFLDLRAGAESGWDFSSRWFRKESDIQSIHTTDMVAVDLNCLLYQLESTIAEAYTLIKQPIFAKRFRKAAEQRADSIRRYCWDKEQHFFTDYDLQAGLTTGKLTLAGVFPLYARIATTEQAEAVAKQLEDKFLCKGGLITTLVGNGQQWDSPNGWAPLQWIAIQGLREYGYHDLARRIRNYWLEANDKVYTAHHKMVEKYDVVTGTAGGGGEYPLQDGFGWTNGVYAALYDEREAECGK